MSDTEFKRGALAPAVRCTAAVLKAVEPFVKA
jgi:hypothetical protein